ncbi:hypothetical protein [Bradyrhizobium sp. CCBAU 11445]|uniref:hypothetical protein n=1 Tax=Bradyrhizobium sp. CCBAU 11445 TaxID=1630896 RepID=UPI00230643E2|nr:hypothetical protein [Bradyrhizobium sp. CCBAU 11445]
MAKAYATTAFIDFGIENVMELIATHKERPSCAFQPIVHLFQAIVITHSRAS